MKIFKYLTKTFLAPVNPLDVAVNELRQARLELLRAETGVEYSMSLVDYNKKRVARLDSYITKTNVREANDVK